MWFAVGHSDSASGLPSELVVYRRSRETRGMKEALASPTMGGKGSTGSGSSSRSRETARERRGIQRRKYSVYSIAGLFSQLVGRMRICLSLAKITPHHVGRIDFRLDGRIDERYPLDLGTPTRSVVVPAAALGGVTLSPQKFRARQPQQGKTTSSSSNSRPETETEGDRDQDADEMSQDKDTDENIRTRDVLSASCQIRYRRMEAQAEVDLNVHIIISTTNNEVGLAASRAASSP
ncbi:hypothetical protein BD410DRAFT_840061 [Rickenella mellea]|uniref:Uncharacterized protein n=1 Tax=Rickenella mellea TaxID=50990 RepID=A0A4Y7Q520_9AGAM|nr:hypothetical protein BD410DRAFT_840061 [Rickenella mellea]